MSVWKENSQNINWLLAPFKWKWNAIYWENFKKGGKMYRNMSIYLNAWPNNTLKIFSNEKRKKKQYYYCKCRNFTYSIECQFKNFQQISNKLKYFLFLLFNEKYAWNKGWLIVMNWTFVILFCMVECSESRSTTFNVENI